MFHRMNEFKGPYSFTSKLPVSFSFNSVINVVSLEANAISSTTTQRIKNGPCGEESISEAQSWILNNLWIIGRSQGSLTKCGLPASRRIKISGENSNDRVLKVHQMS